jgi:DNA-binding transcriptional MocR family regulator
MIMPLSDLSHDELAALHEEQTKAYHALLAQGLKLDLTRGKPSPAQLDLSNELLSLPGEGNYLDSTGTDCRNYGGTQGLPSIRTIFAPLLNVPVDQLVAGDNSSLSIMHDTLVYALLRGTVDSVEPWSKTPIKFVCPVPGYDRHFALCEHYGIEMIPVPLSQNGPDLDEVEPLLANDPSIKGMWIVPMYSNPTGAIYTAEVTRALLEMPAAGDFRIFWDNAYAVHHLTDVETPALDVLTMAAEAGNPNRVFLFASTLVSAQPEQADHRARQDQSPATLAVPQGHRRRHRPDAPPSGDSRSQVRASDLNPQQASGGFPGRDLDRS